MKLFIAEKPDLAKDIVKGLDEKFEQKDGFYQSSNYYVTWCYGHIKGFTSKAGKLFNAKLELVDNTVKFKF
jgi:DNA topoisomerase IA